jgi:hypothetical protein
MMHLSSIMLAIDSVAGSRPVMQSAAELAYKAGAELTAVFIEEDEWFKASRVSFSLQVSSYTGELLPFDEEVLSEQSKAHSKLLEQMILRTGQSMNIRCSYRSSRGSVIDELMSLAAGRELIIIGRNRVPDGRSQKIGRTARFMAEICDIPVLVWNGRSQWPLNVTGIVQGPGANQNVVSWTSGLGRLLKRKTELVRADEPKPGYTPQKLAEDRNRLIVIERTRDENGISGAALEQFPNSVLLL